MHADTDKQTSGAWSTEHAHAQGTRACSLSRWAGAPPGPIPENGQVPVLSCRHGLEHIGTYWGISGIGPCDSPPIAAPPPFSHSVSVQWPAAVSAISRPLPHPPTWFLCSPVTSLSPLSLYTIVHLPCFLFSALHNITVSPAGPLLFPLAPSLHRQNTNSHRETKRHYYAANAISAPQTNLHFSYEPISIHPICHPGHEGQRLDGHLWQLLTWPTETQPCRHDHDGAAKAGVPGVRLRPTPTSLR